MAENHMIERTTEKKERERWAKEEATTQKRWLKLSNYPANLVGTQSGKREGKYGAKQK